MLTEEQLKAMLQDIQEVMNPDRIVLFGSYAAGTADKDSDVDLLVVADTDLSSPERYVKVRGALAEYPASFDIVVKTPEEYERSRSVVNHIVYFADRYGKVLYDRQRA